MYYPLTLQQVLVLLLSGAKVAAVPLDWVTRFRAFVTCLFHQVQLSVENIKRKVGVIRLPLPFLE